MATEDLDSQSPADRGAAAADARRVLDRQRAVWKYLAMFMSGIRQYGSHHPEPKRSLRIAHEELSVALPDGGPPVAWDVSPCAILSEGVAIWEPERAPFDRIPFQLFGDGLRRVLLAPGVTVDELGDLIAILVHDPSSGIGPEDDTVNAIWDRRFSFVTYLAVDNMSEGDAAERDNFEHACEEATQRIVARAGLGEKGWPGDVVSGNPYAPPEAICQVMDAAGTLSMDEAARARLAVHAEIPSDRWTERYVDAFGQGWLEAIATGDEGLVAGALAEWTSEQVHLRRRGLAFGMHHAMSSVLRERGSRSARELEQQVARIMFPPDVLTEVVRQIVEEHAAAAGGEPPALEASVPAGIHAALEATADASLFDAVNDWLEDCPVEALRPAMLAYLAKFAPGREGALGTRVANASPGVAIALVGMLASLGTPAASAAVDKAFESPHVEVRIEALSRLPAASNERVGEELRKLMNDDSAEVRTKVLTAVERLRVKAAGPALALRVQGEAFEAIAEDEKRQALATLWVLNAGRAEAIAIEILSRSRFFPRKTNESSRRVASEALGEHASSDKALEAARKFSKKRWYNTPPVREAAASAATRIEARVAERAATAAARGGAGR